MLSVINDPRVNGDSRIRFLNWLFCALLTAALFGLWDTVFLTGLQHYVFPVLEDNLTGGLLVISHEWSTIFGVPISLLGVIYYALVILLAGMWLQSREPLIEKYLPLLTLVFLIPSVSMVLIQPLVIGAICKYCMYSHVTAGGLFVLSLFIYGTRQPVSNSQESLLHKWHIFLWPGIMVIMLITVFAAWWSASPEGLFPTHYVISETGKDA